MCQNWIHKNLSTGNANIAMVCSGCSWNPSSVSMVSTFGHPGRGASTTPKCWCLYRSFGTILGVNAPINSQAWFVNTWLTLPGFKTPYWSIVVGDYTPKLLLEIVTFHEPVRWESNVTSCRVSSSAWLSPQETSCVIFVELLVCPLYPCSFFLHPLWLHPRVITCDKDTFHKWDSKLYCGECPQKSIPSMAWLPIGWEKMWQKKPKCSKYQYPII